MSPERTGWRDGLLSARHHDWGVNCPAADPDFILIEFDCAEARAIIEYKHELAKKSYPKHPTYKAIAGLANRAGIPFFAARYGTNLDWFLVTPLNDTAKSVLQQQKRFDSEIAYVRFLYGLRGRELPENVLSFLLEHPVKRQFP